MSKLNRAISAFVSAAMLMSSITPVMATGQRQVIVGHETVIPTDDIKANIDSTSERILFASEAEENKMSNENVDINENPAKKLLSLADKNHKSMEDILQDAKQDPDGKTKLQIEVTMDDLENFLKENHQELLEKINQKKEENKNNNSAAQNEQAKKLYEAAKEGNDFINEMLGYNNLEDFFAAVRKGDLNDYKDEILNLINVLFNGDRDAIAAAFGEDFAATLYGEKSEEQKEAEENQKEFKYDSAINSINSALEKDLSISSLLEPLDSSEYKNDKLVLISYDSGLAKNSNTIGYKCATCGNYYSFGLVCSCGKILNGENLSHAKNHGNISFTGSDGKKYELTLTKAMTAKASFAHPDEMPTTDTTVSVVSSTNLTNHELSRMGYSITSDTDQDDELTGYYSIIGSIVCKKCGKKPTLANFSQWVVSTETTGASDKIDYADHSDGLDTTYKISDSESNLNKRNAMDEIYNLKKKIREYEKLKDSEKDESVKKKYQDEMTKLENEINDIQKRNNITYQTAAEKYQEKINDKLQKIADDVNNDKVSVDTLSNIKNAFYMYISKDIIENYNAAKVDEEYYKRAQEKWEEMVKNNEAEKKKKEQEIRNDKSLSEKEKNEKILELGKATDKDIQEFQKVIQYSTDPLVVDADGKVNQSHLSNSQIEKYKDAYNEFVDKIKTEKQQDKKLTAIKLGEFKVATFKDKLTKKFYEGLFGALKAIGSSIDDFNNNSNPFSSKVFYCPDCYLNASAEDKMEAATAVDGKGNYGQLIVPSKIKNLDTDDTHNGYSDKDRQDVIDQIIKILQELLDSIKEGKEDKGLKEAMGKDAYLALVKNMIDANQELADRNSAEAEQKRDEKYNENQEKLEDFKNNDIQQVFEAAKAGTKEAYENLNWMQKTLYEDFKKKFNFTNWQDPEDLVQSPDQKAAYDAMKDMFDKGVLSGSNSEILSKMADYVNQTSISDNEYVTVTLDISNMTASVKSNPATIVDDGVVGIYNDNSQSVFVLNPWSLSSGIDWTWTPTSLGQFVMKRSVSVYDTTENIITYNMNLSAYLDGYENIGVSNCLLQNVSTEYKKYDYSGENSSNVRNVTLDDIVYTVIQGDMTNYDSGKDATERIE